MNRIHGNGYRPSTLALKRVLVAVGLAGVLIGAPRHAAARMPLRLKDSVRGDPADSLYRAARDAINNEEYAAAAKRFRAVRETYPSSSYASDTYYWEAFALYRISTPRALREALGALDTLAQRFPDAGRGGDAGALAMRIRGILARSGDRTAARQVVGEAARTGAQTAASSAGTAANSPNGYTACSGDEGPGIAALSALARMDAARAAAAVRGVLSRRDPCSAPLRQKTVLLATSSLPDSMAAPILLEVVRSDPDPLTRRTAVRYAAALPADRSVRVFQEALRHSADPELQGAAISGLAHTPSPRGSEILRQVVEQPAGTDWLRSTAIQALGLSPGNAAYLRGVYAGLARLPLQRAVVESLGSVHTDVTRRWLLDRAADRSAPVELRMLALFSASRGMAIEPLLHLYQALPDNTLREHLLFIYAYRPEPAARDRLARIAEADPDPGIRQTAIFWLAHVKRVSGADRIPRAGPDSAAGP